MQKPVNTDFFPPLIVEFDDLHPGLVAIKLRVIVPEA
jgi:hypothetical protein